MGRWRGAFWAIGLTLSGLTLSHSALAVAPMSPAAKAFALIGSFQGQWTLTRDGKLRPYSMTYDIASRGSAVTEQFGRELSVFYLDGNRLLMTHFCNVGNQPRLQLRENAKPGVLDFVMIDITGVLTPNDPHVAEIVYRVLDASTMKLSLIWAGGGTSASEEYTLSRRQ